MEEDLVGRTVRKEFPGFGTFGGVVQSYDREAGYFLVMYEDGDSEEVDLDEMAAILVGGDGCGGAPRSPMLAGGGAGRRPKIRRRWGGEDPMAVELEGLDGEAALHARGFAGNGFREGCREVEDATPARRCHLDANGGAEAGEEEQNGRDKRRAGSDLGTPLRRSARQAKAAALAAQMEATTAVTSSESGRGRSRASGNGAWSRSVAKDFEEAFLEEVPKDFEEALLAEVPKPELPPSSKDLDLEGLPVLDLFAVYSCLRAFSKQLFLSPFHLEMFVAALRCTHVNPLIDSVHFALLGALKNHLEILADEGSPSAVHCIRSLNWEFLDLATWPVYLAEYLLIRGSEMRPGIKLTELKLLSTEYYRQPAAVKLELLRSLCDDVLEIDTIRLEVSSRMAESDLTDENPRNTSVARRRKRSTAKDVGEVCDDIDDGNSDECHLCGMDGNLICCDGCPAAFHSRCVGVVEDLLPEGDWYCPECLMAKSNGSRKSAMLSRGAEILGIDPHGRVYFGSCGYLLVADSCDADAPCHYYGQIDLRSLVTVLKPCLPSYSSLINAISAFWGIVIESSDFNGYCENEKGNHISNADTDCKHSLTLEHPDESDQVKIGQDGSSSEQLDSEKFNSSDSSQLNQAASHQSAIVNSPPENGNGVAGAEKFNQTSHQIPPDAKNARTDLQQDVSLDAVGLASDNGKIDGWGCASLLTTTLLTEQKKASNSHLHSDPSSYVNYYSFGQIAASAAKELMQKLSENRERKKPSEDAVSVQLNAICKKYVSICSSTYQKLSLELQKEKCGWCNSCKITGGGDCVFKLSNDKHAESPKSRAVGLRSEKNKKSHILAAMHHILLIEERLNGLLSGPWQNPHYRNVWRKAVLKASDVHSLKKLLLTLESNLRRVAFSVEWQKPADSAGVVGSAVHILVRSVKKSTNSASARKQGKKSSTGELKIDSRDVGVNWWRGGILSRQVFHWKNIPRLLSRKAGRQAGWKKIPTISYPDGLENARRCKHIAWRAAVEMSENVAQLIFQIKELESNIRWTDILGAQPLAPASKESQKIAKLFKKVSIRKKSVDETNVKYLLDFGKREIPSVVTKHGIKLEESSSGRRRYWLTEAYVPLNLLKAFEERKITCLLKKKEAINLLESTNDCKSRKRKRSEGLTDLLEKARKSTSKRCGQCSKEVIASEAVNCQYCAALFHKKHFRVPKGATCTVYICNKCMDEKTAQLKPQQKKVESKELAPKKKQNKQSRDIVTKRNKVVVKVKKKAVRKKKGKHVQHRMDLPDVPENEHVKRSSKRPMPKNEHVKRSSKRLYDKYMNGNSNKSRSVLSCNKRKRTALHHTYWLDGLQWTQKTDDERARTFRKKRVFFPSENVERSEVPPACCLCQKECNGESICIGCEKCEDWFHGEIYSVTRENVNDLIGFKCHKCRRKSIPLCPYLQSDDVPQAQPDRQDGVDGTIQVEDHNSPKELDEHSTPKELDEHSNPKELDDRNSLKDLCGTEASDCTAGERRTEGLLDEERLSVSMSSKEALTITSETGSLKESVALQSQDHSMEDSIPAEHEIDLHVVVTS